MSQLAVVVWNIIGFTDDSYYLHLTIFDHICFTGHLMKKLLHTGNSLKVCT